MSNNPVSYIDPDGGEECATNTFSGQSGGIRGGGAGIEKFKEGWNKFANWWIENWEGADVPAFGGTFSESGGNAGDDPDAGMSKRYVPSDIDVIALALQINNARGNSVFGLSLSYLYSGEGGEYNNIIVKDEFKKSLYYNVYTDLFKNNEVFKTFLEKYTSNSNFRYYFQWSFNNPRLDKVLGIRSALAQTETPVYGMIRDGRDNLIGLTTTTTVVEVPLRRSHHITGCLMQLNKIGLALVLLHEVAHAYLSSHDMSPLEGSMVDNTRAMIRDGLMQYAQRNNLNLSPEQAELLSWLGMQGTATFHTTFMANFTKEQKATFINDYLIKVNNIIYDIIEKDDR